jgi:hypothetical protein
MSKTRTYIAFWDDGHDYGEFTFTSSHRARSKENLADAMEAYKRKFGRKHSVRINWTERSLED